MTEGTRQHLDNNTSTRVVEDAGPLSYTPPSDFRNPRPTLILIDRTLVNIYLARFYAPF